MARIQVFVTTVLFAALSVSAQNQTQAPSEACTNAVVNIFTNPEVESCLAPAELVPLVTNGNASMPIIPPINNWVTSMCSATPCSNETLATIVQNFTTGCRTELEQRIPGYSADTDPESVTFAVQAYYGSVRKVLCLQNGNTNCLTETLNIFETMEDDGTLTIADIPALLFRFSAGYGDQNPQGIPTNVTCSTCSKAAYNTLEEDFPGIWGSENEGYKGMFTEVCGAEFVDGQDPEGVTQMTSDATTGGQDGEGNSASALYASVGVYVALAIGGLLAAV
ncbi:hypothetical protein Moror_7687 [Moniliophthora roreri MCA 2997]|uniref:Uncharacterized protein n=2 Tax=Moniliophthora roreri TaxID=221103 RepID=V2WTS5_MONRO|nr:hypothetical protein Moror_7687 [Moniliophthora roreri MCA 2997]